MIKLKRKVWTSYLPRPKSKPKITPFEEVIRVRILWLGRWFLVQTFEDDELDYETEILEIRHLLEEQGHRHDDHV